MDAPVWQVAALALFAGALIIAAVVILMQNRRAGPLERERQRRIRIHEHGRIGDGMVTDVTPHQIYYSYAIGGVEYRTSQDVEHLAEFLPADRQRVIGPVTLKYSPRNPANSIVVCEAWSGLRVTSKETISNDA